MGRVTAAGLPQPDVRRRSRRRRGWYVIGGGAGQVLAAAAAVPDRLQQAASLPSPLPTYRGDCTPTRLGLRNLDQAGGK